MLRPGALLAQWRAWRPVVVGNLFGEYVRGKRKYVRGKREYVRGTRECSRGRGICLFIAIIVCCVNMIYVCLHSHSLRPVFGPKNHLESAPVIFVAVVVIAILV